MKVSNRWKSYPRQVNMIASMHWAAYDIQLQLLYAACADARDWAGCFIVGLFISSRVGQQLKEYQKSAS